MLFFLFSCLKIKSFEVFMGCKVHEFGVMATAFMMYVWCCILVFTVVMSEDVNMEQDLRKKLLSNHLFLLPTKNLTNIEIGLWSPDGFLLDTRKEIFSFTTVLVLRWHNDRAKWNPEEYDGLDVIRLSSFYLWKPILHLHRGVKMPKVLDAVEMNRGSASVDFHGNIEMRLVTLLTTRCVINLRNFPFDKHTCSVHFQNPSGPKQSLTPILPSINFTQMVGEWQIENGHTAITPNGGIAFFYHLQRKDIFSLFTLSTPTVVSITSTLLTFHVPPASGEKIILSSVASTLQLLLLIQVTWMAPHNSAGIPLIVVLMGGCLAFSSLSLVTSSALLCLSVNRKSAGARPFPKWVSRILCLPHQPPVDVTARYVADGDEDAQISVDAVSKVKLNSASHWTILCIALDRILFWLFLMFYVLLVTSLLN